jgi:DeoR/GlpR family transcriptional regulator of sugar metabolism
MVVTLDGGSTTLLIAQRLARSLVSRRLTGITVITNSIPAATILIEAANEIAAADSQAAVRVLLGGGRIRPSALSVVPYPVDARSSIEDLIATVGQVDISIVGTTGITKQGFSTGTREEATSKSALLAPESRHIIVTDPSKFGDSYAYCFAGLAGCEVVTGADGYETVVDEYEVILEEAGATLTRV